VKKGFWLIDKQHSRITCNNLRYNPSKSLYTITCLVNKLRARMEGNSVFMQASFLLIIDWLT